MGDKPKKINFLARYRKADQDGNDTSANLDEEMEKVFETGKKDKFDVATLSTGPQSDPSPKFGEQDYSLHRKKSYPHTHVPLKALHPRAMRKRSSTSVLLKEGSESDARRKSEVIRQNSAGPPISRQSSQSAPLSRQESLVDSDTGQSIPTTNVSLDLDEGSTIEDLPLSESEAQTSERAGIGYLPLSPERKVQFDIGSPELEDIKETESSGLEEKDQDGSGGDRKKRKHRTNRKYSMPEEPGWRKRSGAEALPRQMSAAILEETSTLKEADQDELVSHRFDVSKGKRRYSVKTKDPSSSRKESATGLAIGKKSFDHSPHEVFVQLNELSGYGDEREWKETARWIKYEEDVEEGAERWGKPHVAPLSFHSLLNLRRCLETGVVILDLEEKDLPGVVYRVVEQMVVEELITVDDKPTVMRALLLRHRSVQDHDRFRFNVRRNTASYTSLLNLEDNKKVRIVPSAASLDTKGNLLQPPQPHNHTTVEIKEETYMSSSEDLTKKAAKESILKRIPIGAEAATVLVGAVDFLSQPTIAFIRFGEGMMIPTVTEVPIPVRFMFILLGPSGAELDYHEIGRSIATLMSNPEFHKIAYKASGRKDLLSAINEFLDFSIVLPPGDWERQDLLPFRELKAKTAAIRRRQSKPPDGGDSSSQKAALLAGEDEKKPPYWDPLQRTRRPWGGLVNDIRRRYPKFRSDIIDGLNGQCIAASIFMYFAALSGAITFGGLMADKTNNLVGISETLLATAGSGIIFALLSGQPLVIIGATGPLLLFDESLFTFCETNGIDYLTMRVYIGIWLAVIALFVSFFEGSVFVKLFTRFTEEIFASLISLLYIVESMMKVYAVFERHPLMTLSEYCALANETNTDNSSFVGPLENRRNITRRDVSSEFFNATDFTSTSLPPMTTIPSPLHSTLNQPNTALFCAILALGTFFIAYYLRHFRNSKFLGRSARRMLGDFGVPIAIVISVTLANLVPGTYTEKLKVPEGLSPSNPDVRGWIIPPGGLLLPLPVWVMFLSLIPALLVYILLFMETHISELIIDKKERKLKKGSGFHLDIVLICVLNVGCGLMGAPFMCAATVRSVTHVSAVTVMSRTHAPGDKPHIIEVKEQRVSALLVSILVGASVLMSPLLRLVPMAVLFGVFLYMGISSINGIQFFDRLRLFLMPVKHHPQVAYVRRVQTLKMHLFTFIQLMCLVILWVVKSSQISLAFPFFLILMVPLRSQLRFLFNPAELRALDSDEPDAEGDEEEPDFYQEALLPG